MSFYQNVKEKELFILEIRYAIIRIERRWTLKQERFFFVYNGDTFSQRSSQF